MTADKRTPHTDALETLGFIHDHKEQRDAIHLAVEPVVAATKLKPGEDIGIFDGKAVPTRLAKYNHVKSLGIVDPFLTTSLVEGDRFWLVIYPRQITSLRHVWSHPDIPDTADVEQIKENVLSEKDKAYKWIEDYAESVSGSYYDYWADESKTAEITAEELIETAKTHIKANGWGDYISYGGLLEGESVDPEFWNQLAIYLEQDIPEEKRKSFFSCSC